MDRLLDHDVSILSRRDDSLAMAAVIAVDCPPDRLMTEQDDMTQHAADALIAAVQRTAAPVCVGIDPVLDRLPVPVRNAGTKDAFAAIRTFVLGVLDAVALHAPVVKFQSACFERYGAAGVELLHEMIGVAHERGLITILDAKRGDIGITAEHYAAAAFDGDTPADWLTINAYFGEDGITPFLRDGHGVFALVRTSNPGGDSIQARKLADGRSVAESIADMLAGLGVDHVGESGYSSIGAVVGATKPDDSVSLRARMPRQILLVPGFGAQGGGAEDVRPLFDAQGLGAMITASRSVIYAFEPDDRDWTTGVRDAAERLADELGRVAGLR
jgi:orotidine-5'-phosphate decarboxylase